MLQGRDRLSLFASHYQRYLLELLIFSTSVPSWESLAAEN